MVQNKSAREAASSNGHRSLFKIQTAAKWIEDASKRPAPKRLFGDLLFEGEVGILFGDTNSGKSILAVQIGDGISRGRSVLGQPVETGPQRVIYIDFELCDKQFEVRYSERDEADPDFRTAAYPFHENFLRAEIDVHAIEASGDFEASLISALEQAIVEHKAAVIIIDNLTYLKHDTERARDASPLMKALQLLAEKCDVTILVLAHTPKRDLSRPITQNDLQGSKMIMNFCDSAFAIGKSSSDSLRYIKHIKSRNAEIQLDADSVLVCEIYKPGDNFLRFEFVAFGRERDYLRERSDGDREAQIEQAKELSAQGLSQRKIGDQLGCSAMQVGRYLKL